MKNVLRFIALCMAMATITSCNTSSPTKGEQVVKGGLMFNESTLPYNGGLLIANFGSLELNPLNNERKGYISFYDGQNISTFIASDGSLSAPKGMLIKGEYLIICDVNKLVAYNLTDRKKAPQILQFPEGELFVNDIVAVGSYIYVSVTNTGNIFKISAKDMSAFADAEPQLWCNIVGANGIVVDKNRRMYIASYPADGVTTADNVIYQIPDMVNPQPQKFTSRTGQWDGLALSDDGSTLYASSWSPAEIVAVDITSGEVTALELETEFVGAADFSLVDGKLYIPDLVKSLIIVKEL